MSGTLGSVRLIVRRTLKRSSTAPIPNATRWLQFMASSIMRNWRWWRRCWLGWRAKTYTSIQRTIMILNPWKQNLKKLVKEVRDKLEMTAYCKTLSKGTAKTRKKTWQAHLSDLKCAPIFSKCFIFCTFLMKHPMQVSEVAEIGGEECPERAGIHNGSSELSRTT